MNSKLGQNVGYMVLYRSDRKKQTRGDCSIGLASRHQLRNLGFTTRQASTVGQTTDRGGWN
jgi:hypothetical protein